MSRFSDQVRDEYGRPVPGVSIYVYKWDAVANESGDLETLTDDSAAPLANPVISDDDGLYYFNSLDGQKLLEFHYGGKDQLRELILVGALPVPQATYGGLFVNAAALTVPVGMDLISTTGYSVLDKGGALYAYDAAVNSAYVTAHPRSSFISVNGRGFRLADEQDYLDTMFGAVKDGVTDDSAAIAAMNALRLTQYKSLTGVTWPYQDLVSDIVEHGTSTLPIVANAGPANFFTPFWRASYLAAGHIGGLQTGIFVGQVRGAPHVSSINLNYTPIQGYMSATVNLGGTGLTTGTAKGALFGSAFLAVAYPGATNLLNVSACEFNVEVAAGASAAIKTGNQIVQMPADAVSGSLVDAGLAFSNQVGAVGWDMALCLSHLYNGQHSVKSTGTLAGVIGTPSCAKGIDFSGVTFSGNAIATPGFSVGPTGAVGGASVAIGGGTTLTKAVVYTPSITPASVAAATVAEQTFTVTGVTTADKIIVNPPAIANATGIAGARVSAADTVAIRFVNPTAGALTPTSGTYTVLALRS